jgi:hypothetical protein
MSIRIEYTTDAECLREIGSRWLASSNADYFGLHTSMDVILADMQSFLDVGSGAVILAKDEKGIVGFFAVAQVQSILGNQAVAIEKYWYSENKISGVRLFHEGLSWARKQGCSHLIVAASNLASDQHDQVCLFCQREGMRLFETAYIREL